MENTTNAIPLWLDIKTEYIDVNFEKVLDYIYKGTCDRTYQDSFYKTTLKLLEQRVKNLLDEIVAEPVYKERTEERNIFIVRLLGTYMLTRDKQTYQLRNRIFSTLINCLIEIVPNSYHHALVNAVIDKLIYIDDYKVEFNWDDIVNLRPQILAHKIANQYRQAKGKDLPMWFENKGTLTVQNGVMSIAATNSEEFYRKGSTMIPSITILNDKIQIVSPKDNKLKKSESLSYDKLDQFTTEFIEEQQKVVPPKQKELKKYKVGDVVRARIIARRYGHLILRSVESDYAPVEGPILFGYNFLFYEESDFLKYLHEGDIIEAVLTDESMPKFNLKDTFVRYIIEERCDVSKAVLAHLIDVRIDKKGDKKITWWTEDGYPAYSYYNEMFDGMQGEDVYAMVQINSFGKEKYYGIINVDIKGIIDSSFDYETSRRRCVESFVFEESSDDISIVPTEEVIGSAVVKEIYRMLLTYQHSLSHPSERYHILCAARIMAELTENYADAAYIKFITAYLEDLVLFAVATEKIDYDRIMTIVPDESIAELQPVQLRIGIVEILKAYGNKANTERLSEIIQQNTNPLLTNIALLVQSCNRIDNVISKSMLNVIKREITRSLSVETEDMINLEEGNGIYLGIENNRQEFKTSFFFAPENAKSQNQELNVFKSICAFLNSQVGGTLYIGVNDLGYVRGIDDEIKHMEKNVFGNYYGIDGYIRYITDATKKYFDLGVLTHIEIKPMYDNKVIAINVRPYEYNIVCLHDYAYMRLNNESVIMNESAKREILSKRIFSNNKKTDNIVALLKAMNEKRQVVLHDYKTLISDEKSDQKVEAYAFTTNYTNLWCYDIKTNENKLFNTSRIGSVEILSTSWSSEQEHRQGKMDFFHRSGTDPIHIKLRLDAMAKNILVEEYPESANVVERDVTENRWILDAKVYHIEEIARFYIGLANHIEILKGDELNSYCIEFCQKYLK